MTGFGSQTREDRLRDARSWSGYRAAAFARQTGTLVVVLDAIEQGLTDDPEERWATICEDHDRLVLHRTLALARSHASDPLGWCEACNGNDPAEEDEDEQETAQKPSPTVAYGSEAPEDCTCPWDDVRYCPLHAPCTLLDPQQLEDVMNGVERVAQTPGCVWWTALLDHDDYEMGEEIDVPARNEREARARVLQMRDAFYDPALTVIRRIGSRAEMVGTITVYSL